MQRIIIFVIFFYSANAQDTISLTFNDLVNLNNSSNLVFKKSDLNYQLSVEEFRNSLASFLPNFSFGDVRVDYNGSAQSTEGEFVDVDKNNKWQGLRWNLDWDLQNILLDPFRYRSKKNEAVFNKKLNNLDEQIRVYVLYYLLFVLYVSISVSVSIIYEWCTSIRTLPTSSRTYIYVYDYVITVYYLN